MTTPAPGPSAPAPHTELAAPIHHYGPAPDAETRRDILALREAAWWAWFRNDRLAFARIVPDELVGIGWLGEPWEDRAITLERMAASAARGTRLVRLDFPLNVFQRYGDVVILYTRFRATLAGADGAEHSVTGRGTEVFVRRNGAWVHTAWHLDAVPIQPPAQG